MSFKIKITEKIIGVSLISLSCLFLYYSIIGFNQILKLINSAGEEISILKVIKNYHYPFIVPILGIVSGTLLLFRKRIGWIGSVIISFTNGIVIAILLLKSFNNENLDEEMTNSEIIIFSLIALVFLIFGITLLNKSFREKYQPTKYTWSIISIIILMLCIDKILIE
ncbi:hypothetical protein [Psychroserpens sp. S379A]|uniref:hypothetical protein n=1 Tax=Psychroserpens sp. S379A TaxID=3415137 RepID=UPI003C7C6980